MKISEVVDRLESYRETHGDLEVVSDRVILERVEPYVEDLSKNEALALRVAHPCRVVVF